VLAMPTQRLGGSVQWFSLGHILDEVAPAFLPSSRTETQESMRVSNKGAYCSVADCLEGATCKGMCRSHYDRMRRRGTTAPYVHTPRTEKRCSECRLVKLMSEFHMNKTHKDKAVKRPSAACKTCYPKQQRKYWIKSKYGITLDQYEGMLAEQGGRCAICYTFDNVYAEQQDRSFAVDHDHETGKVRGLLCQTCNRMLGMASDSPDRLRRAADYLERADACK
jgi:hypothetical protein